MKYSLFLRLAAVLLFATPLFAQQKINITGKVAEKTSGKPLEYATITLKNISNPKTLFGGVTNKKGDFSIEATPGEYSITVEFISFKALYLKQKSLTEKTNLGTLYLEGDAKQLNEVVVRAEKSTVEIKLDKKVYNVGSDQTVKGGTASDVLNNVPSVAVDNEGNVSLRGNDNVKILIDGRPSSAINVSDALKTISADALDKVEVITNPSARYDAEGGAGIINILLKKGKNKGLNGTIIGTVGDPKNYVGTATINFKSENFNLFSTLGYTDSNSPGRNLTNSDYLNPDGSILKTIHDRVNRYNGRKGINYSFGTDWYLDKSLTWTNNFSYRKNDGSSPMNNNLYHYEVDNNFIQNRYNDQFTYTNDIAYTSNFTKKFKTEGHKLTFDFSTSRNTNNDISKITNSYIGNITDISIESSKSLQTQNKNLLQTDYVFPFGKGSQIEAGYKGDFNELITDYNVGSIDLSGIYTPYTQYTNVFEYKEKINALYSQFGSKINKLSYLFGLRYEDSNIETNLLTTNKFKTKKYHNFFPSAFLTYQISEMSTLSLNYSRRVARPRNRFITPFSSYTSNVNIFIGNPNINPSFTDAIDFGYMNKWNKITLTTSLYYNKTKSPFQFIRRPNGDVVTTYVNGLTELTPVYITTPVNLDFEERIGFEFNINYNVFKWWKLNGNFNFFQSKISGEYHYSLNGSTDVITQNANRTAASWLTKISSKITLPYKIDWQTNATYNAPQNSVQGRSIGVLAANIAFSKDILKDKGTLSLNVNDVFNSRKRIFETHLPQLNSYTELQFKMRQINLSFTYRFNKTKSEIEKEKKPKGLQDSNEGGDF